MGRLHRTIASLSYIVLLAAWAFSPLAYGQTSSKAIVLAWDGTVPAFVHEMLRAGKLPNLAKLIEGGALADEVIAGFPSKTASGFASLMTGAPPRATGISGNRVPRAPRDQFTILESLNAFDEAPLKAETLWSAAQRSGKKVVISHIPSYRGEESGNTVRFAGYNGIAGRDGIVTRRAIQKNAAQPPWSDSPVSDAPPIEISFMVGKSKFFGLLIDDPADAQSGYDTIVIATGRSGAEIKAKLKPADAMGGGELFWSDPIAVDGNGNQNARVYFRLFDLKPDGSDLFLYYSRPVLEIALDSTASASATVRAFIGNGASILYQTGGLGRTIANGGNGGAEARYLETMMFAQHQLMETNRWALENLPWDLYLAYTPFPDEAEHAWRGHLDPTLPTFRREIADKLRPSLEQVYRSCDDHLGLLLSKRPPDSLFALISDHGIQGIYKRVALNQALQENGLLAVDSQGRVDLAKTKIIYPGVNNGYLLINSTDRKNGIVGPAERGELVRKVSEMLLAIRDGERQVITSVLDAETDGQANGIGGETGGDLYIELAQGYDFDPRMSGGQLITETEPYGFHGANPAQASMRTLMVLNGPGIRHATNLKNVRLIDFAPTLAWLLSLPKPKDATGRVLYEAFTEPR